MHDIYPYIRMFTLLVVTLIGITGCGIESSQIDYLTEDLTVAPGVTSTSSREYSGWVTISIKGYATEPNGIVDAFYEIAKNDDTAVNHSSFQLDGQMVYWDILGIEVPAYSPDHAYQFSYFTHAELTSIEFLLLDDSVVVDQPFEVSITTEPLEKDR